MTDQHPRIPLSRDRLRAIFLEGFETGRRTAGARRAAAGLAPVAPVQGFTPLAELAPQIADQIVRHDEDLSPRPTAPAFCVRCGGRGWLAQRGDHLFFPAAVPCRACTSHLDADLRATRAREAGLLGRMAHKTFESFRHVPGVEDGVAAVAHWTTQIALSDDIGRRSWLVLRGPRGSGKTHLSLAAANLLVDLGGRVRWFYTADLVDMARSLYGTAGGGEHTVLAFRRELAKVPILILDEFGGLATAGTEMLSRFVEPLLDQRYRENKATLFTLKGSTPEVKTQISASIGRRLEDPEICRVVAIAAGQYLGPPRRPGTG